MIPSSSRLSVVTSMPESASACLAAATPNCTLRPVRRAALKSIQSFASKPFTSPAAFDS